MTAQPAWLVEHLKQVAGDPRFLPDGRQKVIVLGAGTKAEQVVYAAWPKQIQLHGTTTRKFILEGERGTGKALALNTPVATTDGWRTMANLAVGNFVFTPTGRPTRVVWKSEQHIDSAGTYRLTFSDGTEVVCGGSHEWPTISKKELKTGATNKTTFEIANTLKIQHGRETNHRIEIADGWELPDSQLPIAPYVLGVWLGDGGKGTGQFTTADIDVVEQLRAEGETVTKLSAKYAWAIEGLSVRLRELDAVDVRRDVHGRCVNCDKWRRLAARKLCYACYRDNRLDRTAFPKDHDGTKRWADGVLGSKRIPKIYLFASFRQRLALLQGLMDTDGYCDPKSGAVEFCNTNLKLADGVFQLAVSLGLKPYRVEGRATLNGRDCGPKYRVCWTAKFPVFRLSRKLANLPKHLLRPTQIYRYILSAERIADELLQCIQIEDADHLYVATHACIPTHNSHCLRWDCHLSALAYPGYKYLMLRRTMPELEKSHLLFINHEMEQLGGIFHKTLKQARYSNGSIGLFGHCETEQDIERYLSAEFYKICFDEIVTFDWSMQTRISGSCRVPVGSGLTAMIRGGTNPLGESAEEVWRYFIGREITLDEDPDYLRYEWGSLHMTMDDNPSLDKVQYLKQLAGLPEAYRKAWVLGEWGAEGAYFSIEPQHLLQDAPTFETPNANPPLPTREMFQHLNWLHVYRILDWGWHDPTVCLWVAVLPNGREVPFKEQTWLRTPAQQVAADILRESSGMHVVTTLGDPTLWNGEREMGHSMADVFENAGIPMTRAKNDRVATGFAIQNHLNTNLPDGKPKCMIYEPGCPTLVRALRAMRVDRKHPGRIADHRLDHLPICLGYFCMAGVGPTLVQNAQLIPRWMQKTGQRAKLGAESVRRH